MSATTERGRPRMFDPDLALDAALQIFWRKGFDATSLSDLTAATKLNKPSLYSAFGDKEHLYLLALARYASNRMAPHFEKLHATESIDRALEHFLANLIKMFTDPELPGGCFVINGTADIGNQHLPATIQQALTQAIDGSRQQLVIRLQRAKQEKELASTQSIEAIADYLMTLIAGLAVLASSGVEPKRLDTTAHLAQRLLCISK